MKKTLFALAALSAIAGAAQAQSSVTLYGVVDANVEFATKLANPSGGHDNRWALNGGGLSSSRWGLRGVEDLGSGMTALFVLESGFNLDDGTLQQSRLFGRQAFVGLESKQYGRITLGRQYTTIFDALANFSPASYATLYEPNVTLLGPDFRSDNTVKYSGNFGPVTVGAHWSFGTGATFLPGVGGNGEAPGQFRRDSSYGAAVTYLGGPFGATIAYNQVNPSITSGGAFVGTGTVKKAAVAGSYAVGLAKIMAGYRYGQTKDQADNTVVRDDMYWAGANYQLTPALGLTLDYFYQAFKSSTVSTLKPAGNPWQVMFIADYSLSKRTDVYLTTAFAKNGGLGLNTAAVNFTASGYKPGGGANNMLGAAVGVRHKF